jgi:hypothetical protein
LQNVDIFNGNFGLFFVLFDNLMIVWYILCSFGTFFRFGYHVPLKSGNSVLSRETDLHTGRVATCNYARPFFQIRRILFLFSKRMTLLEAL